MRVKLFRFNQISAQVFLCLSIFILAVAGQIISVQIIRAQESSSKVVISEVNWAGSKSSSADEWLELANVSEERVDLGGWSIWNMVGEPKQMVQITGYIPAHGSFLIANNSQDYQFSGGTSTLAIAPDIVSSAVSLSNTALKLELRDATGQMIDQVGDGNKPFAGTTEPITSMERVLSPIALGSLSSGWLSAKTNQRLDGDASQLGTPSASGEAQLSSVETDTQSTPPPAVTSSATTIEAVVRGQITGTVQLSGDISVPESLYSARTVIVSDGLWSAELSLPVGSGLQLVQGDRVMFTAKVSTASVPRLLLGGDSDLEITARNHKSEPLQLSRSEPPRLFQKVHLKGTAHPAKGVLEVLSTGYTLHVTRRQGVKFPTIVDQDIVELTGIIVSLNPIDIRVVEDNAISVTPVAPGLAATSSSENISSQSVPLATNDSHDLAGANSTNAEQLPVLEQTVVAQDQAGTTEGSDSGQIVPDSQVLGARTRHIPSLTERLSLIAAIASMCSILVLLGDSLWQRLKSKQLA